MINKDNLKQLLQTLGFQKEQNLYSKHFADGDFYLKVDFDNNQILFPEDKGLIINERQTCNFSANENFVVFECVHRLLEKGYKPEHIELEPKWKLGRGASGGRADIFVRDQQAKPLLIIECKTAGKEFEKAWKDTQSDGGQLFSYIEQEKDVEFACLYAADFDEKTNSLNIFQRIVSHKDNPKILADNPKLKAFADAKNVKERYKVWKETYQLEYTENGIFEENIQAYQIGKDKYTLDIDTKPIEAFDIKGKYHQFRTILRKYNVSRRENAFEVLVNLFLCKLVDEIENPNDLKFYWKGIAYDNYYDFVDRLQALYQIGMERFLAQDVLYVSNNDIDQIFWAFKQKRNATKQEIKKIFKKLKFFKGLDFEFIKVTNETSFEKNAKILLEIIQMWQGLRLKTDEQNQFLGDMFEYFLDNGIKQSEGQFFTPVPICKFIVMALPLESQLQNQNTPLKVIDYACGSGHFLTEYALQITKLLQDHKQNAPSEYYKNILGIEKEDRLAKVAKISAFMYGRDEINILDADALVSHPSVKNETFDVLIANPPFAVEDFLLTIDETDREKYSLIETANDLGNKNIQCFFLERAKQLLAPNGTMGVIVPSSILSNSDTMHIATREILLQYFDFVSIVELGSNTFGKTGTNTVVLFLRRKAQRPEPAEHYWNRTLDFFDNWENEQQTSGGVYADINTVKQYCQHIEIPYHDYQSLLIGKPNAQLLKTEMFTAYKTDFDSLNDTKKLKESKQFRAKTAAEQQTELDKRWLKYLQNIEQQKIYYFMLAQNNPQKVLLIKSPADNKEQKQFLGYEWSGAKGSEGIKYNGGDTIYNIITPLFDPNNRQNDQKINYYIQQNFDGKTPDIPEHLLPFATRAKLTDLLDFTRKDFNKAFSLTPKNMKPIPTKWELVKIADAFLEVKNGKSVEQFDEAGKFKVSRIESIAKGIFDSQAVKWTNDNVKEQDFLQKGDILFSHINSVQHLAKTAFFDLDEKIIHGINLLRFRADPIILLAKFVAELFKMDDFVNEIRSQAQRAINQASVNTTYLNELKIPLPPLDIQQQIVSECEVIDQAVSAARAEVEQARREIEDNFSTLFNKSTKEVRLNNKSLFDVFIGKRVLSTEVSIKNDGGIPVYSANVFEPFGYIKKELINDFSKGSVLWGIDGDWMVNTIAPNFPFYPTDHCGIIRSNTPEIHYKYLAWVVNKVGIEKHFSRSYRASIDRIIGIQIPVPPLSEQAALVSAVEVLEARILAAQEVIASASAQKQAVLQRYL